jgi:hypothetical protein
LLAEHIGRRTQAGLPGSAAMMINADDNRCELGGVGVPISTGGMFSEFGEPGRAHKTVMREIRDFAPRTKDDEFVVDIAFATGQMIGPDPAPLGVSSGPVGRSQRRFIVWHRLPEGLVTPEEVRAWFVSVLPETERLVREHLPQKSKTYPAAMLADEVRSLRSHLHRLGTLPPD